MAQDQVRLLENQELIPVCKSQAPDARPPHSALALGSPVAKPPPSSSFQQDTADATGTTAT